MQFQSAMGLKHRGTFKENSLPPALTGGLIQMTLPEKPSSRLQRYRLTRKGEERVAALRRSLK